MGVDLPRGSADFLTRLTQPPPLRRREEIYTQPHTSPVPTAIIRRCKFHCWPLDGDMGGVVFVGVVVWICVCIVCLETWLSERRRVFRLSSTCLTMRHVCCCCFAYSGDNDGADARQLGVGTKPGHGCVQRPQPHAEPRVLAGTGFQNQCLTQRDRSS